MKLKILNLYAGIGGNRKEWGDSHDITAVEIDPAIAEIYSEFFPNDKIIVGDAHEYLLNNYKNFDFIWSSPPCPTHSDIRRCGVHRGQVDAVYPEMSLYQEIILLTHFAPKKTKFVIENVKPYYKPLIKAQSLHRHLYWSNFFIRNFRVRDDRIHGEITGNSIVYGYDLKKYNIDNKRKILRNCVDPDLGLHILNCSQDSELEMSLF